MCIGVFVHARVYHIGGKFLFAKLSQVLCFKLNH